MNSLTWRQDSVGLHVSIENPKGGEAVFTIGSAFVNFLMAGTPRMYIVYVRMDGCDSDTPYVLNLEALRPVINKTNGLKISKTRKTGVAFISSGTRIGMYCLARGESYSDRFLGDGGWQAQRVYHDICAVSNASGASAQAAPQATQPPAEPPVVNTPPTPTAPPPAQSADDDLDLDLTL
ncbi:MAG: hypothetical protein K6F33_00500 [Bacteroidales bacterium]|nr:hypothetical protein [Bacteroidales bacterium]